MFYMKIKMFFYRKKNVNDRLTMQSFADIFLKPIKIYLRKVKTLYIAMNQKLYMPIRPTYFNVLPHT